MPEVVFYALGGRSIEQKRALIKDFTDAVVKNYKVDPGAVTITIVESAKETRRRAACSSATWVQRRPEKLRFDDSTERDASLSRPSAIFFLSILRACPGALMVSDCLPTLPARGDGGKQEGCGSFGALQSFTVRSRRKR